MEVEKRENKEETPKKEISKTKIVINTIAVILTILIILFIIYGVRLGIFRDRTILVDYIKTFGTIAPIIFIVIQIVQVIFPVIPGGVSCLAGVLAFGPIRGFLFNYIGIVVGSIIAFALSRHYGISLVKKIFNEEKVNKYLGYLDSKVYDRILFFAILLPGLPDDLFCYISGLSNMSYKKFILILLLGKPIIIALYSVLAGVI